MLTTLPTLETERLILRQFNLTDCPQVQRLASASEVASTTLNIPHPYPEGAAEVYISEHAARIAEGTQYNFAITLRTTGELIGAMGLRRKAEHNRAELGYWIGVPYWGKGYATEAGKAVLQFGFDTLRLNRIFASYFTRNPASARVMQKIGLQFEGTFKEHVSKWDKYEDIGFYGLTEAKYKSIQNM